jgi:hypothetical protein
MCRWLAVVIFLQLQQAKIIRCAFLCVGKNRTLTALYRFPSSNKMNIFFQLKFSIEKNLSNL